MNNNIIKIFHGSENIIDNPIYGKGKTTNDYGKGLYCTESIELAKEWACSNGNDGYANAYELNLDGLKILRLNESPYNVLNWLAVLAAHRTYWERGSISESAKQYLYDNFYVNVSEYDVIIGYRADDSYFTFAKNFVANGISLRQLQEAMRLGKLGEQIAVKSQIAFERIHFLGYENARSDKYYSLKVKRDMQAKIAYRNTTRKAPVNDDIFMIDIMREGMKNGDPRLL